MTNIPDDVTPVCSEVDSPLRNGSKPTAKTLHDRDARKLEKEAQQAANAAHPGFTRRHALRVFWISGLAMLLLYVLDVVFTNVGWKNSQMSSQLFEILKLVATTMIGFLFAKHVS